MSTAVDATVVVVLAVAWAKCVCCGGTMHEPGRRLGKEVRVEVDKGARVEVVEDEVEEHQPPPLASAVPSASSPM